VPHGFLYSIVVPVHSACDLMDVLANPGSHKRQCGFRTRWGVASRVVRPVSTSGRRSYISSRVLLTGALVLYRGRHGGAPIGTGLPWRRGWFHSARDGSTGLGMAALGRR
jgi:hypothetical protein